MACQVMETVRTEVAQSDCPGLSFCKKFLKGPVCAVVVAERLVDKQQVDIVCLQFSETFLEGGSCTFFSCVGDPDLGDNEEFLARNPACGNCISHTFFVGIELSGIYEPVSD